MEEEEQNVLPIKGLHSIQSNYLLQRFHVSNCFILK